MIQYNMAKKTTLTLDSELRLKLYVMKNEYGLKSMEEVIEVLVETKDDAKILSYVGIVAKRGVMDEKEEERVLKKELKEIYGYDDDVLDLFSLKETKNAIVACKKNKI